MHVIDGLVESEEFQSLAKLSNALEKEEKQFNLLSLFDDVLVENAWSRLFAYLFDSSKNHALGQRMFYAWLDALKSAGVPVEKFLSDLPREDLSTVHSLTQWHTGAGRYLDILVQVLDKKGNRLALVGIENKVDSGEQYDQLRDYQQALSRVYPGIPKILLFLSPDARLPQTGMELPDCPVFPCSYATVQAACHQVLPSAPEGQAQVFLNILENHIRHLLGSRAMEQDIRQMVHGLYANPEYREAIKLIAQYAPGVQGVFESLRGSFENCKENNVPLPKGMDGIQVRTYGSSEFKLSCKSMDDLGEKYNLELVYMLRCEKTDPDFGDYFTVRLMALCYDLQGKPNGKKTGLRAKIHNALDLPVDWESECRDWWQWVCLWSGGSYQLVDLGSKDVEGLSTLLLNAMNLTYGKALKQLAKGLPNLKSRWRSF